MNWLFDTSEYMPRIHCGAGWSDGQIWLHVLSDVLIFLAYAAIPVLLIYAYRKSGQNLDSVGIIPRWVFLSFAAFIVSCGIGHLLDAIMFWWPVYNAYGVEKSLTALSSWLTFCASAVATRRAYGAWQEVCMDRDEAIQRAERVEHELRAYIEEQRKR